MKVQSIDIEGVKVIEPIVFQDHRGYFQESFSQKLWDEHMLPQQFIQDNESESGYGVIRGLHYQLPPFGQSKLVRVVTGEVLDVIVDIRQGSPTFGKQFSILLSKENKKQLLIPRGFAHGFAVLSETAIFSYKCDQYYSKEHETGINPLDPYLNIDWKLPATDAILSEKDKTAASWADHKIYKPISHD